VFKVPTLHNVALTPPYFHDGSVSDLDEAVQRMAQLQLGRTLPANDVDDISAFLRSTSSQMFAGRGMGMGMDMMSGMHQLGERHGMQQQMRQQLQQMDEQSQQHGHGAAMGGQHGAMSHSANHHQMMHSSHHGQSGEMMQ